MGKGLLESAAGRIWVSPVNCVAKGTVESNVHRAGNNASILLMNGLSNFKPYATRSRIKGVCTEVQHYSAPRCYAGDVVL